jgi:predicted RNA-binding Zn ribbon-like protein
VRFAHDTEVALAGVAALLNTLDGDVDELTDPAALDAFLDRQRFSGSRAGTDQELASVRTLRARLAVAWDSGDADEVVAIVNDLLRDARALPRLTKHDDWDWHLHLTDPDAPLVDRMGTEAAMAIADLVRTGELGRLRRCEASGCADAHLDLSRNRSRRFCSTTCANRTHVAAYRARRS